MRSSLSATYRTYRLAISALSSYLAQQVARPAVRAHFLARTYPRASAYACALLLRFRDYFMKFLFSNEAEIVVKDELASRNSKFIRDALAMDPDTPEMDRKCEITMPHSRAATMRVVTFWENHADSYEMKKAPIEDDDELLVTRYTVFGATLKRLNESLAVATFLDSEVAIDAICIALGPLVVDIDLPIDLRQPIELQLAAPPDVPVLLIEPWRQYEEMRTAIKAKNWAEVTALASQRRGVAEWWCGLLPTKCEITRAAMEALDKASPMPREGYTMEALLKRVTQDETKKWILEKVHAQMATELDRIMTLPPSTEIFKKMTLLGKSALAERIEPPRFDPWTITLEQLIKFDAKSIITSREARDAIDTLCSRSQPAPVDIFSWLAPVVGPQHLHGIMSHPDTARLFCTLFPKLRIQPTTNISSHEQLVVWYAIVEMGGAHPRVLLNERMLLRLVEGVPESDRDVFGRNLIDQAISRGADPNELDERGECAMERLLDLTLDIFKRPTNRLYTLRGVVNRLMQKTDIVPTKGAFENHPALTDKVRCALRKRRMDQQMQHAGIPVTLTTTLEPYLPESKIMKYTTWEV